MLYAVTKALLSGAIIAMASEVAKRSPALGAVILSLPPRLAPHLHMALARHGRQGSHRHFSAVYVLVRLADAPNVSGVASVAEKRFWVLVCACKFMRPNRAPLFPGSLAASEAGYCLLTA